MVIVPTAPQTIVDCSDMRDMKTLETNLKYKTLWQQMPEDSEASRPVQEVGKSVVLLLRMAPGALIHPDQPTEEQFRSSSHCSGLGSTLTFSLEHTRV